MLPFLPPRERHALQLNPTWLLRFARLREEPTALEVTFHSLYTNILLRRSMQIHTCTGLKGTVTLPVTGSLMCTIKSSRLSLLPSPWQVRGSCLTSPFTSTLQTPVESWAVPPIVTIILLESRMRSKVKGQRSCMGSHPHKAKKWVQRSHLITTHDRLR